MQAVVLGRNYSSLLGMIRAAGKAGCEVTVIRTVRKIPSKKSLKTLLKGAPIESKSKYVKKYLYAIEPDGESLIDLLLKEFSNEKEKVILLPTDDFVASTIDLYQNKLNRGFLFPNINHNAGAVVKLMDKGVQKDLAIKYGLNVAKGWIIKIENGKYQIPSGIEYPCFTKPEISFMGNKRCMRRCNNLNELKTVIDDVAKKADCPILVEQYIEIEKEYGVLGFSDGETAYMPALVYKMATGNGAHRGVTLLGKVKPLMQYPDIKDKLGKMIEETRFVGLFDVDLYEMNGKLYFNELNLRFGAFGYSIMCSGINLPEMFIKKLIGEAYDINFNNMKKNIICLNDKVNLEDYADGYISWDKYRDIINSAEYRFILSNEDNNPEKAYKRMEYLCKIKRFVKRK